MTVPHNPIMNKAEQARQLFRRKKRGDDVKNEKLERREENEEKKRFYLN